MIPILAHIRDLTDTADVWFVDIWGVMHNGVAPFDSAVRACCAFRASGGRVILVSNAPRPAASVASQLDRIGVARDAYDRIVTSGDTARALIASAARPLLHIGPERDRALFDGLATHLTDRAQEAKTLVCTGLADDERETAETYRPLLADALARVLPMVCANPDKVVERGGRIVPCAGAIAELYEALGGPVQYAGKPYLPIYETARALANELTGTALGRERILAIGDGVATDIAGAAEAGLRSVYIASGVSLTGALDSRSVAQLFPDRRCRPVAAMAALAW